MTHNDFVKQYGQEMWGRLDIVFMNNYRASNRSIAEAPMLEVVNSLRPKLGRWTKLDVIKNFLRVKFPGNMEPIARKDGDGLMPRDIPHHQVHAWHREHRKNYPRVFKMIDISEVMEQIKKEGLGPKKPTYRVNKWSMKKEWAESTEKEEWNTSNPDETDEPINIEYVENRKKSARKKKRNGRAIRRRSGHKQK